MSDRRLIAFSLWLVAVLYCWCGAFFKFSFLHAGDDSTLSFWIRAGAVLYCILLRSDYGYSARTGGLSRRFSYCGSCNLSPPSSSCWRGCCPRTLSQRSCTRFSCSPCPTPRCRCPSPCGSPGASAYTPRCSCSRAGCSCGRIKAEDAVHTATFALTAVSAWILSAISVSIMACPAGLGWIPSAHSSCGYRWEERNAERTSIIGHP